MTKTAQMRITTVVSSLLDKALEREGKRLTGKTTEGDSSTEGGGQDVVVLTANVDKSRDQHGSGQSANAEGTHLHQGRYRDLI